MKENWIQLIDTIEKDPFETEAFFALMEYVGEASDDDKRRVVQEVERRIKMIARYDADKSFRFRKWRKRSIPTHSGWLYPLTFDAGKGLKEA